MCVVAWSLLILDQGFELFSCKLKLYHYDAAEIKGKSLTDRRDRRATLKVCVCVCVGGGGGGLTSHSKWGRGGENTFSQ